MQFALETAAQTAATRDLDDAVLQAERTAAALARGLSGDRAQWESLIAQARQTLAGHPVLNAAREEVSVVSECYDWARIGGANAACRVLDNAAQFSPQSSPQESRALGLLAALAFASLGNFPSAKAVVARTFPTLKAKSSREAWLMACASPVSSENIVLSGDWLACKYLQVLRTYLSSGSSRDAHRLRDVWRECAQEVATQGASEEIALAQLALEHTILLSSARVLRAQPSMPRAFVENVLSDGLSVLLPPQWRALEQLHLAQSGENAMVALPPGTGKTLIGETCVVSSLQMGAGWSVFVVPYVALGQQVARALKKHAPRGWRVHSWLGGQVREKGFDPSKKREIVVATPESLDAMLRRNPALHSYLRAVVCDEAHGIGGDARGVRLEGVLTRLCERQKHGGAHRIVLLSAAVQRTKRLQAWIGAPHERVLLERWCATARRVAIWTRDGRITWHTGSNGRAQNIENQGEPKPENTLSDTEFGRAQLAWANRDLLPDDRWPAMQRGARNVGANIARLVEHLHEHFGGPILCVCATKRGARHIAQLMNAHLSPKMPGEHTQRAMQLIRERHGYLSPLLPLLERGACWHHAGLPHDLRDVLELAIKTQEITTVASTTTLAEGVDFPFRWTILVDWLQWVDGKQRPMPPHLFANIAGRCGRAGEWTEGDTLIFDNPLGDLRFTGDEQRPQWLRHIALSRALLEPHSALETLFQSDESPAPLRAALEAQFWAFVVENLPASTCSDMDKLACDFAYASYFAQRSQAARLTEALQEWLRDWSGNSDLLELREGRWQIASLGRAIYESDLSPSSALRLSEALRLLAEETSASRVATELALRLGDLPEQSHPDWRKVATGARHRFALRAENAHTVFALWLDGQSAAQIFASLPSVQKSKRLPTFAAWLEGGSPSGEENDDAWHGDLDKWAEWTRAIPETWLPHLLRAGATLAPALGLEARADDWRRWADWFEHGVNSDRAVKLAQEFPNLTRRAVCELARFDDALDCPQQFDVALKNLDGAHSPDGANLLRWLPAPLEMAA